ncbi:A24 family peptidase [Comamonas composti]|uniref:A24 family peptidase n=1 Tax=Comamonas composti TaxID=408558 RepID=UPI0003F7A069|nr:A24 family peptidase [Comamonas composti]
MGATPSILLLLWLTAIAVMDLRMRKVRNWMVLLGLATGLVALFSGVQPFWVEPWDGVIGMLAAFAALLPFYALRWMGAGDVKFAAVMGLWFGFSPSLLLIWLGGSLLAGLHGLLVLAWRAFSPSPYASWLQARLPLRLGSALSGLAAPAPGHGAPQPALPAAGAPRRVIQRSIPYAGYMALTAIWLVLENGPPLSSS